MILQHYTKYGEKTAENIIEPYEQASTEYQQKINQLNELLPASRIDVNLCVDLEGLRLGASLRLPALPLPTLPSGFHLPEINIECLPSLPSIEEILT